MEQPRHRWVRRLLLALGIALCLGWVAPVVVAGFAAFTGGMQQSDDGGYLGEIEVPAPGEREWSTLGHVRISMGSDAGAVLINKRTGEVLRFTNGPLRPPAGTYRIVVRAAPKRTVSFYETRTAQDDGEHAARVIVETTIISVLLGAGLVIIGLQGRALQIARLFRNGIAAFSLALAAPLVLLVATGMGLASASSFPNAGLVFGSIAAVLVIAAPILAVTVGATPLMRRLADARIPLTRLPFLTLIVGLLTSFAVGVASVAFSMTTMGSIRASDWANPLVLLSVTLYGLFGTLPTLFLIGCIAFRMHRLALRVGAEDLNNGAPFVAA